MDAVSSSVDCCGSPNVRHSRSMISHSRSSSLRRWCPGLPRRPFRSHGSLYYSLLILMLSLCFSPISTLAQPTTFASDLTADDPRSALGPGGEMIVDDLPERSWSLELRESDSNSDAKSSGVDHNDGLLLHRSILTATNSSSSDLPTAFDTLSNNFANATCTAFFSKFRSNSTVTDCHAVSLLLGNSNSFFHTLTSAVATSHVLDVACSQPVAACASIMTSLAEEMLQDDNCGQDYDSNNSVVQSTYQDLMAYEPMYRASCLTNPDTQDYCFVDAVTNTSAPEDYNVYFMPIGGTLGSSGKLTCNKCLQATMAIFAHWASIDDQSLDTTYLPSANVVNNYCGANFATTNVTVGSDKVTAGAGLMVQLPSIPLAASLFTVALGATIAGIF
ncbi:uncharacterized protein N7482_008070 [Penicillium canariense]|uniref:DUF7729 domain-containing protein n=1 Tax=Penicillium canariense TaxID=189055 RepID=A0A9W9LIM2_9EURO|nr:uncharacterized protein N7482_008070 [Penicillium canariense]KAJ5156970.1 hypothetical protein N7482_008070 [Penicillium canariense]